MLWRWSLSVRTALASFSLRLSMRFYNSYSAEAYAAPTSCTIIGPFPVEWVQGYLFMLPEYISHERLVDLCHSLTIAPKCVGSYP
ncbi:uncharacterized protein F4817DRAFT_341282 [Daldinia loculata]|uniref:uncharacterized protein n=1 Tax=Daldinia loculata TaxID=103429 RepID=UPI0020C5424D|nr:uncharacterized protein F4817DRAFT_341282 [Daldinia loculata]KAI1646126.1 hypothetical protein F4817DRAFT_341282 [Daldinia loculata]